MKEFAKRINKHIVVNCGSENWVTPLSNKEWFSIFSYTGRRNVGSGNPPAPSYIYGIKNLQPRELIGKAGDDSISLKDSDTEYTPYEIIGNNLYIFGNITRTVSSENIELFALILKLAAHQILGEQAALDKWLASYMAASVVRSKERYISLCKTRTIQQKTACTTTIQESDELIQSTTSQLVEHIRQYNDAIKTLKHLNDNEEEIATKTAHEFDKISKLDKITKFVCNDKITVTTVPLYCTHPGKNTVHEIGAMQFIFVVNAESKLRIKNLTRLVNGYQEAMHAPHVHPDGSVCLGTLQEVLPPMIATYEFEAAISLCIAFIESVNVTDAAGKFIDRWPLKDSERAIVGRELSKKLGRAVFDKEVDAEIVTRKKEAAAKTAVLTDPNMATMVTAVATAEPPIETVEEEPTEPEICEVCGEHPDDCEKCPRCNEHVSRCMCEKCPCCDRFRDHCQCNRCIRCNELIESSRYNCECERCDSCGELINSCTCEPAQEEPEPEHDAQ